MENLIEYVDRTKAEAKIQRIMRGLSDAEMTKAEAIEAKLHKGLQDGLPELESLKFVLTVLEIQKVMPGATVDGIFLTALRAGLNHVARAVLKPKKARSVKTGVRGV